MKKLKSDKKKKAPWPTKDAMAQVYEMNLWGGEGDDFYSGSGSHHPDIVDPYIEKVRSFLKSFEEPLVVCDLGCGDFNVGRQLIDHAKKYIAVDIVEELINRNKEKYQEEKLEFRCLDLAMEKWPSGDCAILRNVLQHLSNAEIQAIVRKLPGFKYVILTEHVPDGDFIPNKDIISGQGIRLKKKSGVDLLASPFNLEVEEATQWLSIPSKEWGGRVVTTLYEMGDFEC
ncbi:class I SAM-dependent methyltransferase [Gracilimonas mengyeensis]|uniref:Methyltransferase domain-containing protein n=1 Tax=Gracilimonas mengyeensis TaxID=1302730 RepID=A0A521EU55_9BACT|nr:class I SAM-dependent methyltransferase [Gracilimonas mengyeensis]SMO86951.1 Methyltransferase domain-containing protein [Gracilimonas mengyeensis]